MKLKTPLFSELRGSLSQAFLGSKPTCRTRADGTIILQHRPVPTDARTTAQDAQRLKWKDGCDAWGELSDEEKAVYNVNAQAYSITGFNLFMHELLRPTISNYNPTDDALVYEKFPTHNYGSNTSIVVGDESGAAERILVKFDISALVGVVTVTEAKIFLYYFEEGNYPGGTKDVDCHKATSSWTEGAVTWNTQPSFNGTPTTTQVLGEFGIWNYWDITADVAAIVAGGANYGHLLKFNIETLEITESSEAEHYSKEAATRHPYLRVIYST